ncbi:1-acyl-sn-glycerol-3-phosphate acyltransferase [Desulfovibrio sp. X2]|uniref:lysophospholipid acyltransferase family protein n=1 Tax=Desulfovibrio sp. X2 TaxID=941449 RepID=UPI000358E553|nr:lysophospholipid acyltransferase family protein [Desulfovibrio sp. X2]EPR44330.1 1-acyl-sn-glycerol-3-phosphate acyltransferase [Desulfovibrio sp. X2]
MFHNLLIWLVFLPATILLALLSIVAPSTCDWVHKVWGGLALFCFGARVSAELDALEPGKTYVFMANHQSQLDILLLLAVLHAHSVRFVAKQELFSIPVLGWAMSRVGHVAIDRGNSLKAMKSLDRAAAKAREGISIIIFPEGTRAPEEPEDLQEFKIGGMILALKTGLPVVPVIISGTARVLRKKSLRVHPGPVRVRALAPIETTGRYTLKQREAFRDDLYRVMNDAYRELHNG